MRKRQNIITSHRKIGKCSAKKNVFYLMHITLLTRIYVLSIMYHSLKLNINNESFQFRISFSFSFFHRQHNINTDDPQSSPSIRHSTSTRLQQMHTIHYCSRFTLLSLHSISYSYSRPNALEYKTYNFAQAS